MDQPVGVGVICSILSAGSNLRLLTGGPFGAYQFLAPPTFPAPRTQAECHCRIQRSASQRILKTTSRAC